MLEARLGTQRALEEKLAELFFFTPESHGSLDAADWKSIVETVYHARNKPETASEPHEY